MPANYIDPFLEEKLQKQMEKNPADLPLTKIDVFKSDGRFWLYHYSENKSYPLPEGATVGYVLQQASNLTEQTANPTRGLPTMEASTGSLGMEFLNRVRPRIALEDVWKEIKQLRKQMEAKQ